MKCALCLQEATGKRAGLAICSTCLDGDLAAAYARLGFKSSSAEEDDDGNISDDGDSKDGFGKWPFGAQFVDHSDRR